MKKNISGLTLLIIILTGIIFSSCRTTSQLNFEVPVPGSRELPQHIQSLLLVNRVPASMYDTLNEEMLQRKFYLNKFIADTVIFDFEAVDTLMPSLGNLLYETGRYDVVLPRKRYLTQNRSFVVGDMSWDEVARLCKTFNTDAILALEDFETRVVTTFDRKNGYFTPSKLVSASIASMAVISKSHFKVYDNRSKKVVFNEPVKDTVFWEDADESTLTLFKRFTSVKKALTESAISVALEMKGRLGVDWVPEKRDYFSKGKNGMKVAASKVVANNLEGAMNDWKNIAETSTSINLKSKAEFNLAVGYEVSGNLDLALYWALKSYETRYRTLTYKYLDVLKTQQKMQKK